MNSETTIPILIGLVSSLFTVVATKLIDFFTAQKSFHNELRKAAFSRKLEITETVMTLCGKIQLNASKNLLIIDEIRKNNGVVSQEIADRVSGNANSLAKSFEEAENLILRIDLFMDFTHLSTEYLKYLNSPGLFAESISKRNKVEDLLESLKDNEGPEKHQAQEEYKKHNGEAIAHINDWAKMNNMMIEEYGKMQKQLREKFRHYDA